MAAAPGNDGRKEGRVSYVAVAAVLGYAACSVAMVLTNKALAMLPAWRDLDLVLLPVALQNVSALALLVVYRARCSPARLLAALRGLWPGFSRAVWCVPCSVAFVAMILTSFLALSGVSVPFVTVGKNASNLLTALSEWLLLGSKPTRGKALALGIMFFGAFAAAWHDLAFSLPHYSWLALNCASTSAYVLMMRVLSLGGRSLPDREATIAINNGVSLLLILVAAAYKGELSSTVIAAHFWELFTPGAVFLHLLAGCCAFMLNFATWRPRPRRRTPWLALRTSCRPQ